MDYNKRPGRTIEKKPQIKKSFQPTITIVTPFYNGGKTLEETANSVLSQTYPFFEWIIVDDGSKDEESLEKLKNISKMDKRIKVFHKENGGPAVARDYGISKADKCTKYIYFLDCDDIIDKTMIECLYWTLETHRDASFAYATMVNFGAREFIWEKYLTVEQQKIENLICISSMVKKEDLLEVGCFGIKEKAMYEDWNLWLKLLARGKKPIRINAPIFWYRVSSSGEFSRAKDNHEKAMALIKATAQTIKDDVEIIQYPRIGEKFPIITDIEDMTLPYYKKENKKTILFVFPWTIVGGADIFNLELIKRLDKKKYNVIVITTLPSENPLRQDFSEIVSEFYDLATFLDRKNYFNFINYIIESRNVDIVFNSNSDYGYIMLPLIKSYHPEVAIIDYIHSVDLRDKRGSFGRYSYDFDACIDATYTCNNFTTNQLLNDFNKSNVETIYIGTDHKKFDPSKYDRNALLKKYGIPNDKKIISFIARFSDEKRPTLFVDIANQLLKERNDLYFLMAGDGQLYKKTKNDIQKLHLQKHFKLFGMFKETAEIYAMSDITINCSTLEGLALTSYESLSMGVPVVSSNVGGQSELIDNTVGRIVPFNEKMNHEDEINSYVQAVREVLNDLEILKKNTRKKIISNFTLEKMAKKFEEIFSTIKSNKVEINKNIAASFYEAHLEILYDEYKWFCKEYCEKKYGVTLYEQNETTGRKQKIVKKFRNIAIKYGIKNEVLVIFNLLKITYHMLLNIKEILKNILLIVFYFFESVFATIKVFYKFIRKIIKKISR